MDLECLNDLVRVHYEKPIRPACWGEPVDSFLAPGLFFLGFSLRTCLVSDRMTVDFAEGFGGQMVVVVRLLPCGLVCSKTLAAEYSPDLQIGNGFSDWMRFPQTFGNGASESEHAAGP